MDLRLRGKVALVTGSSRGIGLATARAASTSWSTMSAVVTVARALPTATMTTGAARWNGT